MTVECQLWTVGATRVARVRGPSPAIVAVARAWVKMVSAAHIDGLGHNKEGIGRA